jgi:hypothetical protein
MQTNLAPTALCAVLLSGCAPARGLGAGELLERDCSFRSPTTCWVVSRHVAQRPAAPAAPGPERLREPPPHVLASVSDSARPAGR